MQLILMIALSKVFQYWRINPKYSLTVACSEPVEPYITCNCSYENNTSCHITSLNVSGLAINDIIPEELWNLTFLTYLYGFFLINDLFTWLLHEKMMLVGLFLPWPVSLLLFRPNNPIGHHSSGFCPSKISFLLVRNIPTNKGHGNQEVDLDLGHIHTREEKGCLLVKVLKVVTIVGPQLIELRLGHLKFSTSVGLDLIHVLTKSR
ncbi:hypothetical protein CMV_027358 [Castanea mollissima]|uniref:Uncharacterized protein n=1 Tax=Castanea mollissima TaxID=60419 RepID=A0A8J4QBT4_9ROSI|nr:hypothetical protein CMV_027358 [Castanea mollissima]